MAKIAVVTDMAEEGSGYRNIFLNLLSGLASLGHNIVVAGLGYTGKEHNYPFSIIPAMSIQDAMAISNNLHYVANPDVYLVGMDIPLQDYFYSGMKSLNHKYLAITPLENSPLTMSWAAILLNMDWVWFISELGKTEAQKAGLTKVDHLQVGVDTALWHPATSDEKKQLRKGLGIGEDEFVVLTVADNQERKNLWGGLETIQKLKDKTTKKIRYILVTRPDSQVGWKLNDLALSMGLTKNVDIYKRGIPDSELWALYAVSDVYLQPSKAEGLGMPVLEAMACGIPCVATDTGAMHEVLQAGGGFLVPPKYTFIDVWGNSLRAMLDTDLAAEAVFQAYNSPTDTAYVKSLTWDIPVQQVHQKILEIVNEQKS